jgi:lycopene beta-cyclase
MKHVVIVGAGGAGLCLLEQLFRQSKTPLRITVVDADPDTHRNRTWCSWLPTDGLEPYHSAHWRRIRVAAPGYEDVFHPRQVVYAYASGTDVRDHVLSLNDGRHEVEWIRKRATGFGYDGPGQAHVYLGKERVSGDWIFTSWYPGQRTESDLWQHFHGWVVETDHPVFEPDTMTLMDFTVPQTENGLLFSYVLPFDETVALVELTAFSNKVWPKERYEARLEAHMRARYLLEPGQYRIRTAETGRIPMEPVRFPGQPNPATFPIGTISGAVKPSTGYAFERMRRSAAHLVRTMLREGRPQYPSPSPARFRFYDLLLLRILKERPEHGIAIFRSLFKNVPIDVVFRFLDESTRLRQEIGLFLRLPLTPFLKSLWRHVTS